MESLDQIASFDPGVMSNRLFSVLTRLLHNQNAQSPFASQSQPVIARDFSMTMSYFWSAILDAKDIMNSY